MNDKHKKKASKFLSLVLRHDPGAAGLTLDAQGWAKVSDVMAALRKKRLLNTEDELREVVDTNDKKRFGLSPDGKKIRANQGHSVDVDLGLNPIPGSEVPEVLYHGTVAKFMDSIFDTGLQHMSRQHVHLSADTKTAAKVGQRRGKPIILRIQARALAAQGTPFYLSDNGVWLVDSVPPNFISVEP